jgi:hypothetical protein
MRPRRDSARRVASLIAVGTVAGVTRERRKEDRGDIPNGLSTDDTQGSFFNSSKSSLTGDYMC